MARRRRDPEYDWRGIAMLTEQLGQLFQPNQLQLMDAKQKHEMNLLMAKKAWDMELKGFEVLTRKYDDMTRKVESARGNLEKYGIDTLAKASSADGALGDETLEVFDKNDVSAFERLQAEETKLGKMMTAKEEALFNFENLNRHAILGSLYSDTYTRPTEAREKVSEDKPYAGKDYKALSDANKDNVLSYDERMHAARLYVNDYYLDPEGKGTKRNIGGEVVENVTPEGHSFLAGYEHDTGLGKREDIEKAEASNVQKQLLGGKTFLKMTDGELIASAKYNKQIFSDIDKNSGLNHSLGILLEMVDGQFVGTKAAEATGKFSQDNVIMYSASYTNYTKATHEMLKRGIKIPEIVNTGQYDPNIIQEFGSYNTHPDSLSSQISLSDKDDMEFVLNSYNDFLKQIINKKLKPADRRKGILTYQEWLSKK